MIKVHKTDLILKWGDITEEAVDAIVNAANSGLLGGGGVDGAIHRVGGPEILAECKQIRAAQGGCPTGSAVVTTAGRLKAKYVIHTVGPRWSGGGRGERELLASAYLTSLTIAAKIGAMSISFPSISTGAYRFPIHEAAEIALRTTVEFLQKSEIFTEVRFVLFSESDLQVYRESLGLITKAR